MESLDYTQMSVKERIMLFIDEIKISRHKFESAVGVSQGYLSKLTGDITITMAKKICAAYPELSREWLAWGEGTMFREKKLTPMENYLQRTGHLPDNYPGQIIGKQETNTENATLKALLKQKEDENTFLRTLVQNLTTNISNQVK